MRSASMLIDDSGSLSDGTSIRLRHEVYGSTLGEFFPDYAVMNLGFVRIEPRASAASVWLRPEVVAPIAFIRLMRWLSEEKLDRVLFNWYADESWRHSMIGKSTGTLDIVHQIAAIVSLGIKKSHECGDLLVRPTAAYLLPNENPLSQALQLWRDVSGVWGTRARMSSLRKILRDRFVLYENRAETEFVFKEFGDGMPECARSWLRASLGSRVEDHPDSQYGQSCAVSYQRVIERFEPELHDVDAVVWWPQHGKLRRRYKRLLLPFRDHSRCRLLLSATIEDSSINMRRAVS